jgi:hypothetical protein
MTEWTRDMPWRQGQLLSSEVVKAIGVTHPESPSDTVIVIATHDCNLAQLPDKEPDVEVVLGRRILKLDGNYTHGKSARTLHIGFQSKEPLLAEFIITEKFAIPKTEFMALGAASDVRLSPADLATFQSWLASRYRRSAFSDEFEKRLKDAKLIEKIAKAVKPHGEMITAVFFDVDEGEDISRSGSDDVYVLDIILLHITEPDFTLAEAAAGAAKKALEDAFAARLFDEKTGLWRDIELRSVEVVSEEAMSYRLLKILKKWRLDYISLSADPQQPVSAE